jgi:hypothetical protein
MHQYAGKFFLIKGTYILLILFLIVTSINLCARSRHRSHATRGWNADCQWDTVAYGAGIAVNYVRVWEATKPLIQTQCSTG